MYEWISCSQPFVARARFASLPNFQIICSSKLKLTAKNNIIYQVKESKESRKNRKRRRASEEESEKETTKSHDIINIMCNTIYLLESRRNFHSLAFVIKSVRILLLFANQITIHQTLWNPWQIMKKSNRRKTMWNHLHVLFLFLLLLY